MDTTTAAVIVVIIFALVVVAAFILFGQRSSAEINGPFGTSLKVNGSNDPASNDAGIKAQGIKSRKGGVVAEDTTGRGVEVRDVEVESDVRLASKNPDQPVIPKTPPPS